VYQSLSYVQVPKFKGDVFGDEGQAAARKLHAQYKQVCEPCACLVLLLSWSFSSDACVLSGVAAAAPRCLGCVEVGRQTVCLKPCVNTFMLPRHYFGMVCFCWAGTAGLVPEAQGRVPCTAARGAEGHCLSGLAAAGAISHMAGTGQHSVLTLETSALTLTVCQQASEAVTAVQHRRCLCCSNTCRAVAGIPVLQHGQSILQAAAHRRLT
jgi:hypothetical protein